MILKTLRIVTISILFLASSFVSAANRYVATTGSNTISSTPNNCLTQGTPCLTLQYAFSQMVSGDTLNISSGTYSGTGNSLDTSSGTNFIPNGSGTGVNPYTIIKGSSGGGVTIAAPFSLDTTSRYLQFEDLKINYSAASKGITGNHIKIFRTAFVGGPTTGNQINLGIGTNDVTPGADYILLEDVWSYGSGGRYNISIFNSTNVILRRVVIRHDPGWVFDNNNPEGGLIVYNSNNVELQNVIGIDLGTLNAADNGGIGVFHNESNANSLTVHRDNRYVGCIAYNNSIAVAAGWEGVFSMVNVRMENSVLWGNGGNGMSSNSSGAAVKEITLQNVTIGNNSLNGAAKYNTNGFITMTNSIIYNNALNATQNFTVATNSNVLCYGNANNSACPLSTINPVSSGLLYPLRTESGSYLSTNNIGANIVFKEGASGTLFGDPGYNATQSESLWPYPHEARIQADMCTTGERQSSFCTAANLTSYLWNAMGTGVPTDFSPMPTPTGVTITRN